MSKKLKKLKCISIALFVPFFAWAQAPESAPRPKVESKPIELDWQSIPWPTLEYGHESLPNSGSLYTLPSKESKKFRIDIQFPYGVYTQDPSERVALEAAVDLLILGGSGSRNYDALQKYLSDHGIEVSSSLSGRGSPLISVQSLSSDAEVAAQVLHDLLHAPRFEPQSLELWKQLRNEKFSSTMDASNSSKQNDFMNWVTLQFVFGENHYFSKYFERKSPKFTNSVTLDKVKQLARTFLESKGKQVLISGKFSSKLQNQVANSITKLPSRKLYPMLWLPQKPKENPSGSKLNVILIDKMDMPQANVAFKIYYPRAGKLNTLERAHFFLLGEIFSSTGGVVGNDRFSKALRADSGISYSPRSFFMDSFMEPNHGVATWNMHFQAPVERLAEGVKIAHETWSQFLKSGATAEELERTRIAKINQEINSEITVLDKASELWEAITNHKPIEIFSQERHISHLAVTKDVAAVNETLFEFIRLNQGIPVVTIMGKLDENTLSQLEKLPFLTVVKMHKFTELQTTAQTWKN